MIFLRAIIIISIMTAVTCDGGLLIIFYLIRAQIDDGAWHLIVNGYVISVISNIILINLILFQPNYYIFIGLLSSYFLLYMIKHVIWLFGYLKFYKNVRTLLEV